VFDVYDDSASALMEFVPTFSRQLGPGLCWSQVNCAAVETSRW